jgi:hypothetical protein
MKMKERLNPKHPMVMKVLRTVVSAQIFAYWLWDERNRREAARVR